MANPKGGRLLQKGNPKGKTPLPTPVSTPLPTPLPTPLLTPMPTPLATPPPEQLSTVVPPVDTESDNLLEEGVLSLHVQPLALQVQGELLLSLSFFVDNEQAMMPLVVKLRQVQHPILVSKPLRRDCQRPM
jgi:hypothetical protein